MNNSEIIVSIICITYNHEKYIKRALEGFLMQHSQFKYEILIHDDASTDQTATIIKEYASKYPDKITAICQTENQIQKGVSPSLLLIDMAKGKYLAFCEGDDYWTDNEKLQRQVEILEKHPECVASSHNTMVVHEDETLWMKSYQKNYRENQDKILDVNYLKNKCKFCHTASLMVKRSIFADMTVEQRNQFKQTKANGDMKWAALIAAHGQLYHIAQDMACYRYVVSGNDSWTARNNEKNIILKTYEQLERIREYIKKYYDTEITYDNFYRNLCFRAFVIYIKSRKSEDYDIYKTLWKKCKYTIIYFLLDSINWVYLKINDKIRGYA